MNVDWTGIINEVLKVIVGVVLPISVFYAIKAVKAWIRVHMTGVWQEWALEVVAEIEAESKGVLTGGQKKALAVSALKDRGVPTKVIGGLVERAVMDASDCLDTMKAKREARDNE